MKSLLRFFATAITLSALHAQGPLPPPTGAPVASMKTLDQIEPRTDVLTLPSNASYAYVISQSGSYYLSKSPAAQSKGSILISVNDVTLDLNGFTLRAPGTASSFVGITLGTGVTNIKVCNGTIAGWGGLGLSGASAVGGEIRQIHATDCLAGGIKVGNDFTVIQCVARTNGGISGGISVGTNCVVSGCVADGNSSAGFIAMTSVMMSDCVASNNGLGGFQTGNHATIHHCAARSNLGGSSAFGAGSGSSFFACTAVGTTGNGFVAGDGSVLAYCLAEASSFDGFNAGIGSTVIGCNATNSGRVGIRTAAGGHVVQSNAYYSIGNGTEVGFGSTVRDSNFYFGNSSGIVTPGGLSQVLITGNSSCGNGTNSSHHGILVNGSQGEYNRNHVTGNVGMGISATFAAQNTFFLNTARTNGAGAYSIGAGNDTGPLGTAATATSPFANLQ